jgi:CheY-like chemotaxis protein
MSSKPVPFTHLDEGLIPDLVLADYRLPDNTTGLMVMDTVRRRLGRDVPGVLLTGDTSSDRLREATSAQCALLHKPIQPFALQDTVRMALRSGRALRQEMPSGGRVRLSASSQR